MATTLIDWNFRHSVFPFSLTSQPAYNNKTHKSNMKTEGKNRELKHLGLVRMAAIQVVACVSNLYDYAKRNSGPLRSTVGTVEGAVTAVVSPVYEKFKGVPDDILVFLDHKVNEATHKFDKHAPPVAKQVVSQAQCLIKKTSEKGQQLVNEARVGGPRAAVHFAVTESMYFVLSQSVKVLFKLKTHKVADFVKDMSQKGHVVSGYLPLDPINKIATTFKQS